MTALTRSTSFDLAFAHFFDLHQLGCTYRHFGRAPVADIVFLRIDRTYTNLQPSALEALRTTAGVVVDLTCRGSPTDHSAAHFAFRVKSVWGRPTVLPEAAQHPLFLEACQG